MLKVTQIAFNLLSLSVPISTTPKKNLFWHLLYPIFQLAADRQRHECSVFDYMCWEKMLFFLGLKVLFLLVGASVKSIFLFGKASFWSKWSK